MKYIFATLLFLCFATGFGQDDSVPKEDVKLIKENTIEANIKKTNSKDVIVTAEPKGGTKAFRIKIGKAFRIPDVEVPEKTSCYIVVRFVVWDDGSLRNFKVVKESPEGYGLGDEAIRVLMKSKKWEPGKVNGINVKQYFTIPISVVIMPKKEKVKSVEKPIKE